MTTKTNKQTASLKIGYMPLAKGNWVTPWVESKREEGLRAVKNLRSDYAIVGGDKLVTTDAEALALLDQFAAAKVDTIICHFITFSLGTIVPLIAGRAKLPLVLWSMPEPPMTGGMLQSNSFCAVNMNAHALWKMKSPFLHVHAPIETAAPELQKVLGPVSAATRLRRTKVGLVGGRAPGFYTSCVNELLLRREFNVEVEHVTLYELVDAAGKMPAEKVEAALKLLKAGAVCDSTLKEEELRKGAALIAAFVDVKQNLGIDAFSIKCWAEFIRTYGIYVCAILGTLNDNKILAACEGDVYGLVTMIAQNELCGELPFFCDLISIDGEGNTGVHWHCGASPRALANPACEPCLTKYFGRGAEIGLTNQFPLKPGRVTVACLGETRDSNGFRMFITTGEALETGRILNGNPLRVRFDAPLNHIAKTLVYQGFHHHFSLVHGEAKEELLNFCRLLNIEPVVV